jgi:hypothetical protein
MIPVFPYFFMMMGSFIASKMRSIKHLDKAVLVFLILMPVYEVLNHKAWSLFYKPFHLPAEYIMTTDPNPHSIYPEGIHNTNYYSVTHIGGKSKVPRPNIHKV